MRGMADLRTLVLAGGEINAATQEDMALLEARLTTHILPVAHANPLLTLARVLKRLLMSQDELIILYALPPALITPVKLAARLRGVPTLAVTTTSSKSRGQLLRAIARRTGRAWPDAGETPLRLDVGCGSQVRPGFTGIDARRTVATAIVADARAIAVRNHVADQVYASCLLEHFDDPHQVLREVHRVLRPDGIAVLRLPNLGTYSSHLDTTHRFLADLALWRRILGGYFENVRVVPVGTKYRDSLWLVRVNWLLVNVLGWAELAQGWDFVCSHPKVEPSVEYTGWWEE